MTAETGLKSLTHKRVLKIALPIMLSNATVPLLGAVDTGVIGQMGMAAPIGAVGIGAIILTAVFWVFGFLRMGTAGMTAQAVGAGDHGETCALLTRALMIGAVAGVGLIVLQVPLFWGAFKISPASAEVEVLARDYMQIRIFGAPAAIALYGITGWMVAQERTRHVMILQILMNGLNIGLDVLFVLHWNWGVEGVAVATLIAEWSALGLGLWLVRDGFRGRYWRNWALIFDSVILRRMAAVNGDIMIRSVLLQVAFVSFLFLGAGFDNVTLAANQILVQFLHIIAYGMDGFAFAAEALVGKAIGAKNRPALRRAVLLTSFWGGVVVVVLTGAFSLGGASLIDIMTTAPEVQAEARSYLPWLAIAPLSGVASWMLDGIYIGATRTKDMRNMMIISVLIYGGFLMVLVPAYGNHGLWASLIGLFVARGITLGLRYRALERAAL